jgi:putative membrane protein
MREKRSSFDFFIISLKGLAMGAADVVPGVSGGTIAFIAGIYEELIQTIDNLDMGFFKTWKKDGFKNAFKAYNISFLLALFGGIAVSILSLAKLITYLLDVYPLLLWAFFFGLIIASILYIGKQITRYNVGVIIAGILGIVISYYITIAEPVQTPSSYLFIFLSGVIAIIAMILPGISGSFILLLLGSYAVILGTVQRFVDGLMSTDWPTVKDAFLRLLTFMLGCIVGLKIFSKVLTYLFKNYQNITLSLLTGFMIGALNKVWPWKEILSYRENSHGEEVPFMEKSILPGHFDGDPKILWVLVFAIIGFLVIFLLERFANAKGKNEY